MAPGDSTAAGASGAASLHLPDAERTSLLAPDIDDEDEEHPHLPSNQGVHKHNLQDTVRPPVYRDDVLSQQEEGAAAGGIELSDRSGKGRKNETAPLDLLDLQVEPPSTYNQLPPEADQTV